MPRDQSMRDAALKGSSQPYVVKFHPGCAKIKELLIEAGGQVDMLFVARQTFGRERRREQQSKLHFSKTCLDLSQFDRSGQGWL